jgi:hypothetical protein
MQFACFKVKIQVEEVLFLINRDLATGDWPQPNKRTPSRFCRIAKMKGDKMFRSNWENGERGTPEQWKFKPKTTYTTDLFILFYKLNLAKIYDPVLTPN